MKATCPSCAHEFEIETRAKIGEGTRKGKDTKLSKNRIVIIGILYGKKLSVQEVLNHIQEKKIPRTSNKGTNWNYHTVQADLSLLLAGKYAQMTKENKESFDNTAGEYLTETIPIYELTQKGLPIGMNVKWE